MKGRTFIGQLSVLTIILLSLFAILFVSCDSDTSGSSNTPVNLTGSVSYSREPDLRIGDTQFYRGSVEVTYTVNRSATLSYTVFYHDLQSAHRYENGKQYNATGTSVTVICEEDCNINYAASVHSGNSISSISDSAMLQFANLGRVLISSESVEPLSSGTLEVIDSPYTLITIGLDSTFFMKGLGVYPTITYTTDGSDPRSSLTATVLQTSGSCYSVTENYSHDITRIRAYAAYEGWDSAPDTDVTVEIAKTPNPVLPEGSTIMYGAGLPISASGKTWFTTNTTLGIDDIDFESDCWEEAQSATKWVRADNTANLNLGTSGGFTVRVVSYEEGKRFSDIVERSYQVKLPAPEMVGEPVWSGNKMKVLFSRSTGPADSTVSGSVSSVEESDGQFSMTTTSGATISVHLEKEGFVDSDSFAETLKLKLHNPQSSTQRKQEGYKYKQVTLTTTDVGATIHYRLNGVEKTYSGPVEIRETSTLRYWTTKNGFNSSDEQSLNVTVTYSIGDTGPAGGLIVREISGSYYELYRQVLSPQIFGYYATKDGNSPIKVGTLNNGSIGTGKTNTDLLVSKMTGHAYSSKTTTQANKISSFVAKAASQYSVNRTINGESVSFTGWYLPSRAEMLWIFDMRSNDDFYGIDFSWFNRDLNYWTSTEDSNNTMAYFVYESINGTTTAGTMSKSASYYYVLLREF